MDRDQVVEILAEAFGASSWPSPLRRATGDRAVLRKAIDNAIGKGPADEADLKKTALILGSLVLGDAAERVFETKYRSRLSTTDMRLVDIRERRNDTDYRLVNGQGRYLYRINIKFHGSLFRNAREVVGLEPTDCFPLATYKIGSALLKQDQEHLPYVFVVVTGSEISAESIGSALPDSFVLATHYGKMAITAGKRALEERIAQRFVSSEPARFDAVTAAIEQARWHLLSARRAEDVMKAKLFQRVYALRTRSFNRAYRNAEIDMHLSFSQDMIRLEDFLDLVSRDGHFKLAGMLERGTI